MTTSARARGAAARGTVYTPLPIAREIVAHALDPLLVDADADAIAALRVCDPCVGEGAFAIAVAEHLAAALVARGEDPARARARAERTIVGVDVDARAVAIARAHVPGARLDVADALAYAWRAVAPGGFDAVVGNPPYVREEQVETPPAILARYAVHGGGSDLYAYFVELAHALARPGGRYALIIPTKWMTAAYGRPLRTLLGPTLLGIDDRSAARVFAGADAFPCIVWGVCGGAPSEIVAIDRDGARGTIPRARWGAEPWSRAAAPARALLDHVAACGPALGTLVARPQRGVVTGCNAAFVVDRATADALRAADPANAAFVRPFVKGRDLRPLAIADAGRWILLIARGSQPTPSLLAHLAPQRARLEPGRGRKPGPYAWYELQDPVNALVAQPAPRLLYQDIQTYPACALDDGTRVPDTTIWMLPTADRTLLALLNSSLYAFYARHHFPPALGGAVRPKWEYLQHLPVAARLREPAIARALAAATTRSAIDDAIAEAYALDAAARRLIAASISNPATPATSATSATLNTGQA